LNFAEAQRTQTEVCATKKPFATEKKSYACPEKCRLILLLHEPFDRGNVPGGRVRRKRFHEDFTILHALDAVVQNGQNAAIGSEGTAKGKRSTITQESCSPRTSTPCQKLEVAKSTAF